MIDWSLRLNAGMRGLAVEGKDDRVVLEAFLDAGEREGRWQGWRSRLAIEPAKGVNMVRKELETAPEQFEIWALEDQDWSSVQTVAELQANYPRLRFLPRVMIENYVIDPDELVPLIPPDRLREIGESNLRQTIENAVGDWLLHGALSQVLYEHGAGDFCTTTSGYPNRLLNWPHAPVTDENVIETLLSKWHKQLDPLKIMPAYRHKISDFRGKSRKEQYCNCIEGKMFFRDVIVNKILNRARVKRSHGEWLEELASRVVECPTDLVVTLTALLN